MTVVTKAPTPANVWQGTVDLYIDVTAPASAVPAVNADEVALDANGQPSTTSQGVTAATNATPIVLTVTSSAAFNNGELATVSSVGGNTNANGIWATTIPTGGTTIQLNGSAGNAAYTVGGTIMQGAHVGLLEGPTTCTLTCKIDGIGSDTFEDEHDAALTSLEVEIDTVMKESDLAKFLAMTSNPNYGNFASLGVTGTGTLGVQMGGAQSASMQKHRLMFVGPQRNVPGQWIYVFLFVGYNDAPCQITFSRAKANLWKVKFVGLANLTRTAGDEVAHIVWVL